MTEDPTPPTAQKLRFKQVTCFFTCKSDQHYCQIPVQEKVDLKEMTHKVRNQQHEDPGSLPKSAFFIFHTLAHYIADAVKIPRTDTTMFILAQHMTGNTCVKR